MHRFVPHKNLAKNEECILKMRIEAAKRHNNMAQNMAELEDIYHHGKPEHIHKKCPRLEDIL